MSVTAARTDRGSITGFVVVITLVVLACAGLAIDGSRIVGAHVAAADVAENAARAGAQAVVALRHDQWVIEPSQARVAAEAYLATQHVAGVVTVTSATVTVTVTVDVETTLLGLVGIPTKHVSATRSSNPISG